MKSGDLVFTKTTQEPCFVLSIKDTTLFGFTKEVHVRRPVMTENGILHKSENFFLEELETADEQRLRIQNEYAKISKAKEDLGNPGLLEFKPTPVN